MFLFDSLISIFSSKRMALVSKGGLDSLRRLFHSYPHLFTPHLIFFRKKRKACLLLLPFGASKFSFSHSPFGCAAIFHYFMPPSKWEKEKEKEKKQRRRADLHEEEKSSRHTSREREKERQRETENSSAEGDEEGEEEEEDFDQSSTI